MILMLLRKTLDPRFAGMTDYVRTLLLYSEL
jgi:hypothetical protein